MLIIFFKVLTLNILTRSQLCKKKIEESFQSSEQFVIIQLTYQIFGQPILNNRTMFEIISPETETEIIQFSYSNYNFWIYKNNQSQVKSLDIYPGSYVRYQIECKNYKTKECNYKIKIHQYKEMQFKMCLHKDFVEEIIQELPQQLFLSQYNILEIDNKYFDTSFWLKEIIFGNQPIQIIFSQPQGCIFQYNFKTNKLLQCNPTFQKEVIVKQSLQFNIWFYFEFHLYCSIPDISNYYKIVQFEIDVIETFKTIASYSFENQLTLDYPNSIISNFRILQYVNRKNELLICMPDCKTCDEALRCIECKMGLILENGMCYCNDENQFSDYEGNCKYPANFLQLRELEPIQKCKFGFQFSDIFKECIQCPYENTNPDLTCLLRLPQEKVSLQVKINQEFFNKFSNELQKFIKNLKCPKNCLSCEIIKKTLFCLICKSGSLDFKNQCKQCKIKNCQYCISLIRETCLVCYEFYSLNIHSQCVRSKEYAFDKLLSYLKSKYMSRFESCLISSMNECILCLPGSILQNEICIKSQQISVLHDSNSMFAKFPQLSFGREQTQFYIKNLELLNYYKFYFESSIKSKIYIDQQTSNFIPKYYSKNINQYSFCKQFNDCDNYLELEIKLMRTSDGMLLLFEDTLFDDLTSILNKIQLYDISVKFINVRLQCDFQYIGINHFKLILELEKSYKFIVKVNFCQANLFNDIGFYSDRNVQLNISTPEYIFINETNFINDNTSQLTLRFDNIQIEMMYVLVTGNVSFIFQNQTKVAMSWLQITENFINTAFVFKFLSKKIQIYLDCISLYHLQIKNTIIFDINSAQTYFEIRNSMFHNISFLHSSLIFQGLNVTQQTQQTQLQFKSQIYFENLRFHELKFDSSQIFQQTITSQSGLNQVLINQNSIEKCKLKDSNLYIFEGDQYQKFQVDSIMIHFCVSQDSLFFLFKYFNHHKLILQNITFQYSQHFGKYFMVILAAESLVIQDLNIYYLAFKSFHTPLLLIDTKKLYINNFNITNNKVKIWAQALLAINAISVKLENIIISCSFMDNIILYKGFVITANRLVTLLKINFTNINLDGDCFIAIQNQTILIMREIYFTISFVSNPYVNQQQDKQTLIKIQSYQNFQVIGSNLQFQLFYNESQQFLRRCAIYSTGQQKIKLYDLKFYVRNNGSLTNSLILIEGNVVDLIDIQIKFTSYQYVPNMFKSSNYIFHIFCESLNLSFIDLDINSTQLGVVYLVSNIFQGGRMLINNINLQSGSQIDSFLTVPFGAHNFIILQTIQIMASINNYFIYAAFPQFDSKIILKYIKLIQQNQKIINAIGIDGVQYLYVDMQNVFISKNHISRLDLEDSNINYLRFFVKYCYIKNLEIKYLNQPAMIVQANKASLRHILIQKMKSNNAIIINEASSFTITDAYFIDNSISSSIIEINCSQQVYVRNLYFKQNIVQNGHLLSLMMNDKENDSSRNVNSILLAVYNLNSIQNICDFCFRFVNNINLNALLEIKESILTNNKANKVFELKNLQIKIQDSFFNNKFTEDCYFLIDTDQKILINNSQISLDGGNLTQNTQTEISKLKSIVESQRFSNEGLEVNQNIKPSLLKLAINRLDQEIELNYCQLSQNTKQFLLNNNLYFPSGSQLNGYKILNLKQRQYFDYLNSIYIFGYNEYNNIKLQINKCDLTTDNNNIEMTPNYIDSKTLLSDVVFTANPYLVDQFKLSINCNYDEIQLQLLIDSKLFKCQLGEILYNNQCQQCNIKYNLYSVKKHSQLCKLVDYDKIQNIQVGLIQLKEGYWRPYYSNDQIEQCQSKNCLGGWDVGQESCKQGYTGPLCTECDQNNIRGNGHYSKYRQQCYQCQYEVNYIYNILYILGISLITLTITTRSQYLICQRYQMLICSNKYYQILNKLSIDQISVLIKQIQNYFFYLQFVNIIFDVDLNLGIVVNTVSNPIQVLNPQYDCLISQFNLNQQLSKIIIQIITPICILTIFYTIILIINRYVKFKYFYVFIYTPILQFFIIYQIIICQSAISHLTYIEISGIKWIYGARQYQYFESSNIHLFALQSAVILIFALFIPIIFVLLLYIKQYILQNIVILMKIGYLYQEYTNHKYYWEFLKMTIKLVYISLSFALISNFTRLVPISTFYLVYIVQLLKLLQPYYLKNLNQFDQQFHILFIISLLIIGIIHHVEEISVKSILTFILYSINLFYFCGILKIIITKAYYNNPQIMDNIRSKLLNSKGKSLVETKKKISSKYSLLKRYAKAQTKQINDTGERETIMHDPIQANSPMLQSNIMSNNLSHQEIELVTFKQK